MLRFDHHQKEFDRCFSEAHQVARLSSAGLVYKYFGLRVLLEKFGGEDGVNFGADPKTVNDNLQKVYEKIYCDLFGEC